MKNVLPLNDEVIESCDVVSDEVLEGYSGFKAVVSRSEDGTMSQCYSSKC
jgi:hypothetical protein